MLYTVSLIKADGLMHIIKDSVPFLPLKELVSYLDADWPGKDLSAITENGLYERLDQTAGALALKMGPQLVALITIHAG